MNMDAARRVMREVFGFEAFREGQEQVVGRLLGGRSVVAIFPTGAGKSMCYQLPALVIEGLTIVVSPLIALMKDQLDFLTRHGVAAARLDSTLDVAEARRVQHELDAGRLKLLYVAPERFASERFREMLRRRPPALLAVDEAHCISEWGHNFRPDYLKLARLARELGVGRVLALTATATPAVAEDIAASFGVRGEDVIRTGFHRPNLHLEAATCRSSERLGRLVERIGERGPEPAIVYTSLQRTAEEVASELTARGFPAQSYHAGLEDERRHAVQDWFMSSRDGIVVATIAFGMGVDKADIRAVYHYNLPKSLENYAQEIGRAGRDGGPAWCEVLASPEDVVTLENFSFGDTPDRASLSGVLEALFGAGSPEELALSPYDLSIQHDIRPLVLDTVLTYVEMEGLLESTGAFYLEYKLRMQGSAKGVLPPESARFLDRVLSHAKKGSQWYTLLLDEVSRELRVERPALVSLLADLEERGAVEVKTAGLRRGYRKRSAPASLPDLLDRLSARFEAREQRDLDRLRQVLELVEGPGCITSRLLAHFGETLEACGHCARCAGRVPAAPVAPARPRLTAAERAAVRALVAERHPALARPRQLARFLCGLSSPATTRAKLSRDPRFASLARLRLPELLGELDEHGG